MRFQDTVPWIQKNIMTGEKERNQSSILKHKNEPVGYFLCLIISAKKFSGLKRIQYFTKSEQKVKKIETVVTF